MNPRHIEITEQNRAAPRRKGNWPVDTDHNQSPILQPDGVFTPFTCLDRLVSSQLLVAQIRSRASTRHSGEGSFCTAVKNVQLAKWRATADEDGHYSLAIPL